MKVSWLKLRPLFFSYELQLNSILWSLIAHESSNYYCNVLKFGRQIEQDKRREVFDDVQIS